MPPGEVPPGWEPGPTDLGSLGVRGVDCARLSVGRFERPARLVWEMNFHAAIPAACRMNGTGGNDRAVLNSLYVEDAELGAYLAGTYGMPVQVSNLTAATRDVGGVKVHAWTWGPVGLEPSTLSIVEDTSTPDTPNTVELFWRNGDGVGAMRIQTQEDRPFFADRHGHGTMRPPMQMAAFLGGNFEGPARWYPSYRAEGKLSVYRDRECKTPA